MVITLDSHSSTAEKIQFGLIDKLVTIYVDPPAKVIKNSMKMIIGEAFDKSFCPLHIDDIEVDKLPTHYGDFIYFAARNGEIYAYVSQTIIHKMFFIKTGKGYIFSNNMESMLSLLEEKPQINWNYMISFVKQSNIFSIYTPFLEVHQIPCGCLMKLSLESMRYEIAPLWKPTLSERFNQEEWQDTFLERVKHSLFSIAQKKKIYLQLSGGIDSSLLCCILALMVKERDIEVEAINLYNEQDINSDERAFAERVAIFCNIPLVCLETSACLPFTEVKFIRKPSLPTVTFNCLANDLMMDTYASSKGGEYIWISGHGGDSLFHAFPPIESIADAILNKEYGLALQQFRSIRRHLKNPYLKDLITCLIILGKGLFNVQTSTFLKQISPCEWLIEADLIGVEDYKHPFYQVAKKERILPGKMAQIDTYYITLASAERLSITHFPFLSQEVVETAFAVPTYKSFDENYNRLQQRLVLEKVGNATFAYRKTKGHTTRSYFRGMQTNYSRFLELCMEGKFVQNGHVNKEKLYKDIKLMAEGVMQKTWSLTNLYCAELYLNEYSSI